MTTLSDQQGRAVTLGRRLGGGGEGDAFAVEGQPALAAKVYHQAPASDQVQKLGIMAALGRPELFKVAAWPSSLLFRSGGQTVGFLMPLVQGCRDAHALYSPARRPREFPRADFAFLLRSARNCAVAFEKLHQAGVVIGDVNQSNALVSQQAEVTLIDCDSFQVQGGGRVFPCNVGVPFFTPPELQGRPYRGLVRTADHDRFGLAVLIFHLLFLGRHPFAGRYLGGGDMPIEQAIKEGRFAYGRDAQSRQMRPPLHALPLSVVPPALATCFEKAFASPGSGPRPTGLDWVQALDGLAGGLRACTAYNGHVYPAQLGACPWCDLIREGVLNLFAVALVGSPGNIAVLDLAVIWAAIDKVRLPSRPIPQPPQVAPTPLPPHISNKVPPQPVMRVLPPYHPAPLSPTPAKLLALEGVLAALVRQSQATPPKPGSLLTLEGKFAALVARGSPPPPPKPARLVTREAVHQTLVKGGSVPAPPQPPSRVARPTITEEVIPPTPAQQWFVVACLACAFATVANFVFAGVVPKGAGFFFGFGLLCSALAAIFVVLWWGAERMRRAEQAVANEEYESQMRAWREAVRRERDEWKAHVAREAEVARRKVDAAREAVLQEQSAWEAQAAREADAARRELDFARAEVRREQEKWGAEVAREAEAARRKADAAREAVQQEQSAWEAQLAREADVERGKAALARREEEAAREQHAKAVRAWEGQAAVLKDEASRRRRAHQLASNSYADELQALSRATAFAQDEFRKIKDRLAETRRRHERLRQDRLTALAALQQQGREAQLQMFLSQQLISDHQISGIGEARKAALESFGIEAALDVEWEAVLQVPGIGDKLARTLLSWRQTVEQRFKYDSSIPVPEHMRKVVEAQFASPLRQNEEELLGGPAQLERLVAEAEGRLRQHENRLAQVALALAQAVADLTVLPLGV